MYKPKPLTDSDLDKFLADLESQYATAEDEYAHAVIARDKAQAEFNRLYKQPMRHLTLLEGIAGASLLLGALSFVLWWLYPIYLKILGGIR